jgi:hypothetical protein
VIVGNIDFVEDKVVDTATKIVLLKQVFVLEPVELMLTKMNVNAYCLKKSDGGEFPVHYCVKAFAREKVVGVMGIRIV